MTASVRSFCLGVMVIALSAAGRCVQATPCGSNLQSQVTPDEVSPKLSVVLSAVEDAIQAGSPLKVKIVTTNTSDRPLWFSAEDLAAFDYGAVVCDEKGNAPPDTLRRRVMRRANNLSLNGGFFDLPPGQSITTVSDVGQLYDFGQPGSYAIYVRVYANYENVVAHRSGVVTVARSNAISVRVIPAEGSQPAPPASLMPTFQPSFKLIVRPESQTISWSAMRRLGGLGPEVMTENISHHPETRIVSIKDLLGGLELEVMTKNTSDHNTLLWFEKGRGEQAGTTYQVDIRDDDGKLLPQTEFARYAQRRTDVPSEANPNAFFGPSGERLVLNPGESWSDRISPNRLYDFPKPSEPFVETIDLGAFTLGRNHYSIQVRRFDAATGRMVTSNAVTVTLIPGDVEWGNVE